MENHSNSHPNSRDSSPTSRELLENDHRSSFDEPPSSVTKRVKLICSFGGKIQPRLHDGHFSYIGGDTKILAVDRNVKLSNLIGNLTAMADSHVCFKYQLPGEDLDALISVCNEDDLDYMMIEYDRLCRASTKPARLRIFLFPSPLKNHSSNASFDSINSAMNLADDSKSEGKWFVDALNSVHVPASNDSSPPPPPPSTVNPDYLFGLDKPYSPTSEEKYAEIPESVPDFAAKDTECEPETVTETEIHEIQRMQSVNFYGVNGCVDSYCQGNTETETPLVTTVPVEAVSVIVSDEQKMNSDGENGGVNATVDCYSQENTETETPLVTDASVQAVNDEQKVNSDGENGGVNGNGNADCYTQENSETEMPLVTDVLPAQVPAPLPASVHSGSVQFHAPEPVSAQSSFSSFSPMMPNVYNEPIPVYLIRTPSGLYQAVRPFIGATGEPVYFAYTQIRNEFGYNGAGVPGYSNGSYRQGFPSQAAVAGVDSWN